MSVLRPILLALLTLGAPVQAQTPDPSAPPDAVAEAVIVSDDVAALARAVRLDDLIGVLREEGLASGRAYEADMFPSGGGPGWASDLDQIYDVTALRAAFVAVLEAELAADTDTLAEILEFYATDLGQRVVTLEIEARRAFLDDTAEDAARVAADKRRTGRDPRAGQIERFIAAGDLLEMNVAGALSGNLAFMSGMNDSGAYGPGLPQDQLMQEIWGQEARIREDTLSWLNAYLGLAYQPLSEADLDAYIAFMESPAGKRLNAAMFVAFDQVFRKVSYNLGRAAGVALLGRDI
ncbi:MAG: DUF2059 domain-containing protein [Tabrizicola sp.]